MPPASAKPKAKPSVPRPSSSVIVVSPQNEILLLHRVKTSTSFASAHVFPGGNLDAQDGPCPPEEDLRRHEDAPWYRNAALRELFEESGILLAKDQHTGQMLAVPEHEREQARHAIHQNKTTFAAWLKQVNPSAVPDTDNLIPFSRWITPTNVPKRYTTQMYLYFLPLPQETAQKPLLDELPRAREEIQIPTSDGGVEIAEARFLPAAEWLRLSNRGEIILFPPQFLLLHLASRILDVDSGAAAPTVDELARRRKALVDFVHSGSPPWTHKCISPKVMKLTEEGRSVLALDNPGPELKGSQRRGESDLVVLVQFKKGSVRHVDVRKRGEVLEEERKKSSL